MQRPDPKEIERIRMETKLSTRSTERGDVLKLLAEIDWLQHELESALDPTNPEESP